MNPREIVLEQIRHHETEKVPYTLAFEEDVAKRLDRHYGGPGWRDKFVPYVANCGSVVGMPHQKIGDNCQRDPFGTVWRMDEEPPVVVEPALKGPSFDGYTFPPADLFRDPAAKDNARKQVEAWPQSFTIVSPWICLWNTWYLRGFEDTLMDCAAEEDFYSELLERMTLLCLELIKECADVPSDAIMMGDDWGDQRGILIGPDRWRRFFKPRYERIFRAIHDQGKIAIMHCCGSAADIMPDLIDIGLDVLESVQPEAAGMNPYELKRKWGANITFWGCLGSQQTIPFGTPEVIRSEIRRLRQEMSRGGGYIMAPAKPIRPETPTENAVAVVEGFLEE